MKTIHWLFLVVLVSSAVAWNTVAYEERFAYAEAQTQPGGIEAYHFRPEDSRILREKYPDWSRVDEHNRGHYAAGGRLPEDWRTRMQPVPIEAIRELVLPPPGYVFGYIDGYCVVYDAETLVIADAIDLATFESDKNPR